jgi:23S rRNA (uracil1939-C5)-methyltransferase
VGRKRNRKPFIEGLVIEKMASEGKSMGKYNDKVVFVPNTIPGDIVDVQVTKKRKNFLEGYVAFFHKHSDIKVAAFCEHFGVCGGCKWQNLPYEEQLAFKQQEVMDHLKRLGNVEVEQYYDILGSEKTQFYRNKLEFTFSNKRYLLPEEIASEENIEANPAVGFHVPKFFDKVVDIKKCFLQEEPSNEIRNSIREYAFENDLSFFDLKNQNGFLRTLIVRSSSNGELMIILSFYHEDVEKREGLLEFLKNKFPQITSLMYVINEKANDTITDQDIKLFHGRDHIFEEMEGLKFKIGPKSFYQTNSDQAYNLYKITREYADISENDVVYDLYTGTGTIANFVAKQAKKVVGIEYVPEAIEDAKLNSELNKIANTSFFAGDMKDVLNDEFISEHGTPDVIIVDPPRAGMHASVVETILNTKAKRIVYVSCNSATQARDIALMQEDYKAVKSRAVDMFPHTHHVENVVLLERR